MKYKTCSHLKEDFGPLGNSPVLLLLSPGKTPLKTTVAKFLDTSVCGALDALTPASVRGLTLKVTCVRSVMWAMRETLTYKWNQRPVFSIYVKKRREREYNINVIEHVSTAEINVCELSGQHEENGLPEKDWVFFFLFFRFIYTRNNSRGTARLQTAQDSVTLFLKVFVLYSPLVSINASKCYWGQHVSLNI